MTPRVSSALKATNIRQEPPPMIIGERLSTRGSRKANKMILTGDYDGLVKIARNQVEERAHCLDVCTANNELNNEKEVMVQLVKRVSLEVDAPLVIDSTEYDVIESALEQIPGRPIINSINLEGDGTRFKKLAPLMAKYGVPAIAMCIGPEGMAKEPQDKVKVAEMLYNAGKEYGLKPEQFIFDPLTFTLTTGQTENIDAGRKTIEGIKLIKEKFPNSYTVLGLSNISFGIKPHSRRILNSVFLYHCVKAELDCVIINAKDIVPYTEIIDKEKKMMEDIIFNKHPNALPNMITYFENITPQNTKKRSEINQSWDGGKKVNFRIINRLKEGIERDVVTAIAERNSLQNKLEEKDGKLILNAKREETHHGAIQTLNLDMLPAMKEVGDKFGSGELILPFVLNSAECMKAAVTELEKYLLKEEDTTKGRLVLGTVYGDVHDIGKNLVKTIFENNGYTVYDLGKQVPMQSFLDKIDQVKADAVGLSALLVSTSKQMRFFVEYARKNNIDIPILCGGAAINTNYINRIAKDGGVYKSGVFYCRDMFEGLKTMDSIISSKEKLMIDWYKKLKAWREPVIRPKDTNLPRSKIQPITPPVPPHLNTQIRLGRKDIDLEKVWELIDKKSLFKLSWGIRGKIDKDTMDEHEEKFLEWRERFINEDLFEPHIVYGYFKCRDKDGKLEVDGPNKIIFDFPRSAKEKHLCLTDYFGKNDIVAFQSVTVGNKIARTIEKLDADDKYTESYYLHGLAVELAEALAEWTNQKIKSELNLKKGGLRYSWGFPSCPDVMQHKLVWELIEPQKSEMDLTEGGQIVPEQSTAAIIVHHPDAEYFTL